VIVIDVAGRAKFDAQRMTKSTLALGEHLFAGLNAFEPGQEQPTHTHARQDKLYFIVAGRGEVKVGNEFAHVGPGDLVLAPAGAPHSLRNPGPERLIAVTVLAPPRE
jgi:mannose-6-phosphate isomerase-like protein (cupin superfamily)